MTPLQPHPPSQCSHPPSSHLPLPCHRYVAVVRHLCGTCAPWWQPGGIQESLKPAAALSIVVYTIGLPVTFLGILLRHRHAIFADQTLRMANEGATPASNPNFHIRRRYQELYRCGPLVTDRCLSQASKVLFGCHRVSRACCWRRKVTRFPARVALHCLAAASLAQRLSILCPTSSLPWCRLCLLPVTWEQHVPSQLVLVAPCADVEEA